MSQLTYMFASLAARCQEGRTCLDGMRLLADTLHPHGVKITWMVSPESAQAAADTLTRWHEEFGDGVAVNPPAQSAAETMLQGADLAEAYETKKALISEARDRIAEALPWATLTVAAGCHTDPDIPAVLEDLGFEGLWGFCWEQIEIDAITDRGCPWGLYYMDRGSRLKPAQGQGVVGMEWTARDLLKGFHSGNPTLYSTDPNDVGRGGLCSWDNIDYWKGVANNYIRNLCYNEDVFLLQHQEAHEMQRSDLFQCYTEEDIREAAMMLDAFVRHIKEQAEPYGGVAMRTLDEAAAYYRGKYPHTASSYMLWEDTPHPPHNRDYALSLPVGPWPKTFLHYDREAQMMFIEGKVEPICIRNYARDDAAAGDRYFAEPDIPVVRLVRHTQHQWRREIELTVDSPRAMPYGIALWGQYALYQLDDCPGLIEGKMLSGELVFLRYRLEPGENRFTIRLQGK